MKNLFKIFLAVGLAFTMASCGSQSDVYGNNYPNNGPIFRAPDGTVYRRGDVYRDRNGNVYENGRIIRRGDVTGNPGIFGKNTNIYGNNNRKNLPPGQAKKIYGGSAKDYAPGQVKKRNRYYDDRNRDWDRDRDDYKKNKNKKHKKHK